MKKHDKAAKIADKARQYVNDGEAVWSRETIAKDIRQAIAAAVRKERKRFIKAIDDEVRSSTKEGRFLSLYNITKAIKGGK